MSRPTGDSTFTAPLALPWMAQAGDDAFERHLLGFCVASLLDQRAAVGENRTYWAGRLGLSKSHISKMTESPTPAFIERFVLALTDDASGSPIGSNPSEGHDRLSPLLSDFYADLRPPERSQPTRAVLKWFARYQPEVTAQLTQALFQSEVALERCRMLERAGGADYDEVVRESMRDLLVVTSGPYGGSVIALHQCAELGLMVPSAFFEEVEATLNSSPVGFRVLRTIDRFVRLWQAGPAPSRPRQQAVDALLPRLIGKLAAASASGTFLDPYPGKEWGTALAGECLKLGRPDLTDSANSWLLDTLSDPAVSQRGRLHAAWVLGCAQPWSRDQIVANLEAVGEQSILTRWAPLLDLGWRIYGDSNEPEEARASVETFEALVREEFAGDALRVDQAVESEMGGASYAGLTRALSSLLFAALVTPDGRLRRAMIEGVANAGLVAPAADILSALLGIDADSRQDDLVLVDDGLRETAIFLLGRLRQPKNSDRVAGLRELATSSSSGAVKHAAVWAIGDLWKQDLNVDVALQPLSSIATGDSPWVTRVAAAHVLAIMAHQEAHQSERKPDVPEFHRVSETLNAVLAHWAGDPSPGAHVVRAISLWGTRFDPQGGFDVKREQTLSGVLEGNVTEQYDFGRQQHAVGLEDGAAHAARQ